MWNKILIILFTTQLALPYVLGYEAHYNHHKYDYHTTKNPGLSCSKKCGHGEHCELQQVICCCAPCFPVQTCVENSIPGCKATLCAPPKICVLQMASTHPICINPETDNDSS